MPRALFFVPEGSWPVLVPATLHGTAFVADPYRPSLTWQTDTAQSLPLENHEEVYNSRINEAISNAESANKSLHKGFYVITL